MFRSLHWQQILGQVPATVMQVLERLKNHGFQAYIVGGAPRNILLRRQVSDWDIATNALPTQVEELFAHTVPLGKKFGTILVREEGISLEITTFRREKNYEDGRHPENLDFISRIEDDLARRDFTINALALDPLARSWLDPFQGKKDIRRRLVKTVGDPHARFSEDPLRMLRFFRFQSTLNFRGDKKSMGAVQPHLVDRVSRQRIQEELTALLTSPHPGLGLRGLIESGLLFAILPEFKCLLGQDEPQTGEVKTRVIKHLIRTVETIKPRPHLRWAALLHDLGKGVTAFFDERGVHFYGHEQAGMEMAAAILVRLRLPNTFQEKVLDLIRWHMFPCDPNLSDAAIRRLVNKVGRNNIEDLLELRRADIIATTSRFDLAWQSFSRFASRVESILEEEKVFSLKDLAIDGNDVMAFTSLKPGPRVGQLLEKALHWVLEDPRRNTREQLKAFIVNASPKEDQSS